jgi:hypothetical protein
VSPYQGVKGGGAPLALRRNLSIQKDKKIVIKILIISILIKIIKKTY